METVATLHAARLVTKTRRGREQLVRAHIDTVRLARATLDELESLWHKRIDRRGELLAEDPKE